MERLTNKEHVQKLKDHYYGDWGMQDEIYLKLAEYEDKLESGELVNITDPLPLVNGRFTKKDGTYYERSIKRLWELENGLESGQTLELPCKVGDTVYGVGMYGCQSKDVGDDEKLKRKIYNECMKHNGRCKQCKYSLPHIEKFVCTQIQISGDGIWICGEKGQMYPAAEIYADENKANAELERLQKKYAHH